MKLQFSEICGPGHPMHRSAPFTYTNADLCWRQHSLRQPTRGTTTNKDIRESKLNCITTNCAYYAHASRDLAMSHSKSVTLCHTSPGSVNPRNNTYPVSPMTPTTYYQKEQRHTHYVSKIAYWQTRATNLKLPTTIKRASTSQLLFM